MPLRTAARRCPDAVFLPADNAAYEAASEEVMAVLRSFGPTDGAVVEVMGWDEAFVGAASNYPEGLAGRIREAVTATGRAQCGQRGAGSARAAATASTTSTGRGTAGETASGRRRRPGWRRRQAVLRQRSEQ